MGDYVRTSNEAKARNRALIDALRLRLNEWDPIGVADEAPTGEYDCMHGPILAVLRRGGMADELAVALRGELVGHFELGTDDDDFGEAVVAADLVRWYRSLDAD